MDQNTTNPEPTGADTPHIAFGATGVVTDAPQPTPETTKSKKGLKVGLITGAAVLLAAGGGFSAYAYIHNQPENILLGAFSNIVNAENLQLSGSILSAPAGSSDVLQDLRIELGEGLSKNGDVTVGANAKITAKIKLDGETKDFSVTTDGTFVKDGTLYLKLDGMKQVIDAITKAVISATNASLQTDCAASYANIGLPATDCAKYVITEEDLPQEFNSAINSIAGTIDGQWWKIAIEDIVGAFAGSIPTGSQSDLKEAYSCVINQLHTEMGKGNQYLDLFKKNAFATITKADSVKLQAGDAYELKIDAEKAASYFKEAGKIVNLDAIKTCLQKSDVFNNMRQSNLSTTDEEEFDAGAALTDALRKMPKIYLGISGWNPQIVAVQINYSDEESSTSADLKIDYPAKLDYSAPSDAKSITDLIGKLSSLGSVLGF